MTRRQPFEPLTTTNYDVVIVGTGLSESILAASLAIAGATVLHLDPNAFYGAKWSTLSLAQLVSVFEAAESQQAAAAPVSPLDSFVLHDIPTELPIPPAASASDPIQPPRAPLEADQQQQPSAANEGQPFILPDIPQHARMFPRGFRQLLSPPVHPSLLPHMSAVHIDLTPRPTMAAAPLIDLLVRTNIGHYLDFRPLSALYLDFSALSTDNLSDPSGSAAPTPYRVPASRADIFQHRFVTPIEKRLLARFVKSCLPPDPIATPHAPLASPSTATAAPNTASTVDNSTPTADSSDEESFADAMTAARLTPTLKRFVLGAVLYSTDESNLSVNAGRAAIVRFHASMRRYATPTPFLYPNHGTGELAQAFCRLCAVHGGTYVLRRGAAAVLPETGVVTVEGEIIRSRHTFIASDFLARSLAPPIQQQQPPLADLPSPSAPPSQSVPQQQHEIWRFAGVIDASILSNDHPPRCMIVIPDESDIAAVWLRQLDAAVMVCPPQFFLVYGETIAAQGSEEILLRAIRRYVKLGDEGDEPEEEDHEERDELSNNESSSTRVGGIQQEETKGKPPESARARRRPRLLWGVTYARVNKPPETDIHQRNNLGFEEIRTPENGIDMDGVIHETERCFRTIYPDGEFFPERTANILSEGTYNSEGEHETSNGVQGQSTSPETNGQVAS